MAGRKSCRLIIEREYTLFRQLRLIRLSAIEDYSHIELTNTPMNTVINKNNQSITLSVDSDMFRYEIWPHAGGILNRWSMKLQDEWFDIIHAFDDIHDFRDNLTQKGFPSCKLSPYACRIRDGRYTFENKDYQIGKFGYDRHSIHGLLYDMPFEVVRVDELEHSTSILLGLNYMGTDAGFPFEYSIYIEYIVSNTGEVRYRTKVQNTGSFSLPLMDGWHPYFSLPSGLEDCVLAIDADECLEFDQDLIPTGQLRQYNHFVGGNKVEKIALDHCFPLQDKLGLVCTLTDVASGLALEVKAISNYPYLQLFIPPDRRSIAIELLSGAPDAFNNNMGLITLQPSEVVEFECVYSIVKL